MSELFLKEKQRYIDLWKRLTQILKQNRGRYSNKNDVLEEALDALEEKIAKEK